MKRLIEKNNSYWAIILLFLIALYALKGALYPTGIISKIVALLELAICCVLGLKALKYRNRNNVINIIYLIIIIISYSYIISEKEITSPILGKTTSFIFIRAFLGAVLPMLGMYYLARADEIEFSTLTNFFYIVFFCSIIAYFYETITIMLDKNQEITSNESYRFVYIMPFIVFLKGKLRILIFWGVAICITVLSAKRGAIIGVVLECLVYYWWEFRNSNHKIYFFITAIIICSFAGYYLYEYYLNDIYLQMRVEATLEGKTSGRDILISKLLNHYGDSGIKEIVFGAGFIQTVAIAGNYAHNDWIEILIDCGLIGLCLYLLFYVTLLDSIFKSRNTIKRGLLLIFIAIFPASFYSMVFFSESASIAFLWLGYILGTRDRLKSYVGSSQTKANNQLYRIFPSSFEKQGDVKL